MTDIVERLRETQNDWPACLVVLEFEAADTIEALRAENAKLQAKSEFIYDALLEAKGEIVRLREALKPFADLGMRQAPGSDGDTFIVNIPSAAAIRAARAAMGESDE